MTKSISSVKVKIDSDSIFFSQYLEKGELNFTNTSNLYFELDVMMRTPELWKVYMQILMSWLVHSAVYTVTAKSELIFDCCSLEMCLNLLVCVIA